MRPWRRNGINARKWEAWLCSRALKNGVLMRVTEIPANFMTAKIQNHKIETYIRQGLLGLISNPFDPMGLSHTSTASGKHIPINRLCDATLRLVRLFIGTRRQLDSRRLVLR